MIKTAFEIIINDKVAVKERLEKFEKSKAKVVVWTGIQERNSFKTQISLGGFLEQHETDTNSFRILNDNENYTYFTVDNVIGIFPPLPKGELEIEGYEATIRLRIDSPKNPY